MRTLEENSQKNDFCIDLCISIVKNNGKPAIQLRKIIANKEDMRKFIEIILTNDGIVPARVKVIDPFSATVKLKSLGLI